MNLTEFNAKYADRKDAEKIQITCDHPSHTPSGEVITIGKQPAKRNIMKNGGTAFICRQCVMKYDNPALKTGQGRSRQTDEVIRVRCPDPRHEGDPWREMKKSCYFGKLCEPYEQLCGSCAQLDKEIPEEQRAKISDSLTGRKLSKGHVERILEHRRNNPEWAEQAKKNLIPGMGGIARQGLPMPEDWRQAISDGTTGKPKTDEHRRNISKGRKKMLQETGGFTKEHRENISKATIRQYKKGFDPKLHHISGWHQSPKAGRVFFRSSYEKRAYLKLDADEQVRTYKPEAVEVTYYNPEKDILSTFLVDIEVHYLDGSVAWIEVKPEKWLSDEVVAAKLEAAELKAEALGIPFEVWTELKLFGMVYNERHMREFARKVKEGEV